MRVCVCVERSNPSMKLYKFKIKINWRSDDLRVGNLGVPYEAVMGEGAKRDDGVETKTQDGPHGNGKGCTI